MTSQAGCVQPSRIAAWLVDLFAPAEEAESILGDLLEEFSHLASKSGIAVARSWYWRQTSKTIAHLVGMGFRVAPWSTAAAMVGGFFLMRFTGGLPGQAVAAALHRYRIYEHHSDAYIFCLKGGFLIGQVIVATLVGGIVAAASRGREMTAATTLGLFRGALAVSSTLIVVARTGDFDFLRTLPWSLAFAIATIVGGAMVRMRRSTATAQSSAE